MLTIIVFVSVLWMSASSDQCNDKKIIDERRQNEKYSAANVLVDGKQDTSSVSANSANFWGPGTRRSGNNAFLVLDLGCRTERDGMTVRNTRRSYQDSLGWNFDWA